MSGFGVFASLPEDQFLCSLCLDVFSDPVTTPCGHNFCRTCLSQHWDKGELCHCPTCNKRFPSRPDFFTNAIISEISVQIKKRKIEAMEGEENSLRVMCDVCTHFKLQASKSCLVCLVSYCEAHLEPHHRVPTLRRHGLIEPVENLEERVCEKHSRVMELFCRQERVCICLLCSEAEHKGHQFVPVEEEAALQRENIESKEAQIKLMINDRMEKIKGVTEISEMSKVKAAQEMEHSEKLFTTLMEKVQNNQTKLKSNIEEKMRKFQERMQTVVGKLQEQIAELQRKNEKLQEISRNQDSLHLLQTLHSLQTILDQASSTQFWVYSDLCLETLRTSVSHIIDAFRAELKTLTCTELTRMRKYKESVTFDPSTAGGNLVVSDFGKRLKHPKITYSSSSSDDTDKFNLPMILGTKGFTSGRHYWEVIVGLRNNWDVGVAAETADRSGGAVLKRENGFFAIGKRGFDYQVHATPYTVLHLCPRPKTLGVYLDYDEGRVSFYDVGEKLHIHSFVGMEFTGKLFPYFYLYSKTKKSEPLIIGSMLDYQSLFNSFLNVQQDKAKLAEQEVVVEHGHA